MLNLKGWSKDQIKSPEFPIKNTTPKKKPVRKTVNVDGHQKQLDDIIAQIDVVSKQIEVSNGQINTSVSPMSVLKIKVFSVKWSH